MKVVVDVEGDFLDVEVCFFVVVMMDCNFILFLDFIILMFIGFFMFFIFDD